MCTRRRRPPGTGWHPLSPGCPTTKSEPFEPAPLMLHCVCGSCSHVGHSTVFPQSEALPVHARSAYICAVAEYKTSCKGLGRINWAVSMKSQGYRRCIISVSAKQYTIGHTQLQRQLYTHTTQHIAYSTCSRLKTRLINRVTAS